MLRFLIKSASVVSLKGEAVVFFTSNEQQKTISFDGAST